MKFSVLALSILCFCCCCFFSDVESISFRIFKGREDCVSESIPENQLTMLRESFRKRNAELPINLNVAINLGFLATNSYGGETGKGSVVLTIRSPKGDILFSEKNLQEETLNVVGRGEYHGWQACFQIDHTDDATHTLTIELSYFTVNMRALVGTEHEKSRDNYQVDPLVAALDIDMDSLAKSDDLNKVLKGLRSSSMQLTAVRQIGHHLKLRTERHMKTVKTTHSRTLYWSIAVSVVLVCASLFQVFAVRSFFKSTTNAVPRV